MTLPVRRLHMDPWFRCFLAGFLSATLLDGLAASAHRNGRSLVDAVEPGAPAPHLVALSDHGGSSRKEVKTTEPPRAGEAVAVEIRFTDESTLRMTLREERLEVQTPYGRLSIPLTEIQRIDFGTRIPEATTKRIEAAINDLGNTQFPAREAASAELLKLREKAFPALQRALKHKDPEVVRRADRLLEKLRESVPEEQLEFRKHDVIQTEILKISGRIEGSAFKAHSHLFGDVQLKLADIRSLRSLSVEDEGDASGVQPGPTNMVSLQQQIGKTYRFRVTGAVNGSLWGTDVYTSDSTLAVAAVHAGVLRAGQTGTVKVKIVMPPAGFQGSSRNGVNSGAYGIYSGAYQIVK